MISTQVLAAIAGLRSVAEAVTYNGRTVQVYDYNPIDVSSSCIIISVPKIERVPNLAGETQLGSRDVTLTWDVSVMFEASDLEYAQKAALGIVCGLADGIDDDCTLGGVVEEARLESAEHAWGDIPSGYVFIYDCTVKALLFA